MGGGTSAPIGELALVSGVFIVFFCAGVYVAAALGMLGLLAASRSPSGRCTSSSARSSGSRA